MKDKIHSKSLPERLKFARNKTEFTQQEVAIELKTFHQNISRYETGENSPDLETLARLADFYGQPVDWFIGIGKPNPSVEPVYKTWDGFRVITEGFNERLRAAREQKELSQGKVAKKIGITRSTITRYETGLREPDLETLAVLCLEYRVSADRLLGLSTEENKVSL